MSRVQGLRGFATNPGSFSVSATGEPIVAQAISLSRAWSIKEWGLWIRQLRAKHNLKQAALAEMVGVDQATVSRWEAGRTAPDAQMQGRIRALMGHRPFDALLKHWIRTAIGGVALLNSSRTILAASDDYCSEHGVSFDDIVGTSCDPVFTDEGEILWQAADDRGFFSGEIASVSVVTLTNSLSGHLKNSFTKYVWMPMRLADGEIVMRCEQIYLNEGRYARARTENGGPIRITKVNDLAA